MIGVNCKKEKLDELGNYLEETKSKHRKETKHMHIS